MKNELWLIWKDLKEQRRYKVGVLSYKDGKYFFEYLQDELDDAIKNHFTFYPGFEDLNKKYESSDLFSNILTRLPNKDNPNYLDILNRYDLSIDSSSYDILKSTRGKLLTDTFEFVEVFNKEEIIFDVAGKNYSEDFLKAIKVITRFDKVLLELEPSNEYDKNAIKVILKKVGGDKYHIGYVPRYYAEDLAKLLKENIEYSALIYNFYLDQNISKENYEIYVKILMNNK